MTQAGHSTLDSLRKQPVPERLLSLFSARGIASPEHLLVLGGELHGDCSALLISRQPRALSPDTAWLRSVFEHFSTGTAGASFVGTLGQSMHEAPLWAAANSHKPVAVVLPQYVTVASSAKAQEKAFAESGSVIRDLLPSSFEETRLRLVLPVWPENPRPSTLSKEDKNHRRDLIIAGLASSVFTLGVSPGGTIHRIVEALSSIERESAALPLISQPIKHEPVEWPSAPDAQNASVWTEPGWLSHYVRSCVGPWPGQMRCEYYSSLQCRDPLSEHTAFDTLRRIIREGTVRASDKWVRGDWPVVSLTESTPAEVMPLHRYMKHLVRWDFEPYAIRVRQTPAVSHGAMQVAYIDDPDYWRNLPQDKLWWFQPKIDGRDIALEKEWRFRGGLLLKDFSPSDIRLLVPAKAEAELLRRESPFAVDALEST